MEHTNGVPQICVEQLKCQIAMFIWLKEKGEWNPCEPCFSLSIPNGCNFEDDVLMIFHFPKVMMGEFFVSAKKLLLSQKDLNIIESLMVRYASSLSPTHVGGQRKYPLGA